MKTAEPKTATVATVQKANQPFFSKKAEGSFFGESSIGDSAFFKLTNDFSIGGGGAIQKKCTACGQEENRIQRQEEPGPTETKPASPDPKQVPVIPPKKWAARAGRCVTDPAFPDFACFAGQLKLDIDENILNNAHQFYQAANLHPGDNELMWNTFLRYGIGVNLLQTNFGFLGTGKKWGNILSYGTGIGMKSYQFIKDGALKLDIQIPVGKGVHLDIKFDYNTNPVKPADEKVNTSIGISGRF